MKPVNPLSRSSSPLRSSSTSEEKPFDEINISDEQLDKKIEKLERKGYFTIPMKPVTRRYLEAVKESDAKPVRQTFLARSFIDTAYERMATATAERIISRIYGAEQKLQPHEFEKRWPGTHAADRWHQDSAPKLLTCIATIEGSGTQFITPQTLEKKFATVSAELTLKEKTAITPADIRHAKPEKFLFFAAKALTKNTIPKLLHRAPTEAGRSIFMARWLKKRQPKTDQPDAPAAAEPRTTGGPSKP